MAFATASINGNYVRPSFNNEKGKLSFVDARHPCVEKQDQINFISNSVELDRNGHRFQVITGLIETSTMSLILFVFFS